MNLDLDTADRYVYNVLDWVATLGGFLRGLRIIFGLLLIAPLYNFYEMTMIGHLYHAKKDENNKAEFKPVPTKNTQVKDAIEKQESEMKKEEEDIEFGPKSVNFCKQIFFDCLTKRCREWFKPKTMEDGKDSSHPWCCRREKSYDFFDTSYDDYLNEVNIVKIIG